MAQEAFVETLSTLKRLAQSHWKTWESIKLISITSIGTWKIDLRRLNRINFHFLYSVDAKTPIEETIKAMDELRKEGKVKYIGMSECSAATLRKASKVAKIDVLQIEYSLVRPTWKSMYVDSAADVSPPVVH